LNRWLLRRLRLRWLLRWLRLRWLLRQLRPRSLLRWLRPRWLLRRLRLLADEADRAVRVMVADPTAGGVPGHAAADDQVLELGHALRLYGTL